MRALLLAGLCLWALPAQAADILTPEGLGSVKIGMTHAQIERAIGGKIDLSSDASGDEEECATANWRDKGLGLLFEHHRLASIYAGAGTVTTEGAGTGTSETQLRKLYGRRAVFTPHPYDNEHGHYVTVKFPGKNRALIFETLDGKVTSFRIGYPGPVERIEGCS